MLQRGFGEIDLRTMLEQAIAYRPMREHYLEITYRKGKPLAAYLYLSAASGVKSVRTESKDAGLMVDFGPGEQPIGLEITAPEKITAAQINAVLRSLDLSPMKEEDLSPLEAV